MILNDFIDNLVGDNYIINILGAYAVYEIIKGVSVELSNIIFGGDTFPIPILNANINLNKLMKHVFIFMFAIIIIVVYYKNVDNKNSTNSVKKGGKKNNNKQKLIKNKKKVKFVKN